MTSSSNMRLSKPNDEPQASSALSGSTSKRPDQSGLLSWAGDGVDVVSSASIAIRAAENLVRVRIWGPYPSG